MTLPADAGRCQIHQRPILRECLRCGDFGCDACFEPGSVNCSKCVQTRGGPAPAGVRPLDANDALNWVFKDPSWGTKIAIGAVCMLFSGFMVPMFLILGWELAIARRVREDPRALLPEWDDVGGLIWDGLKSWLVVVIPVFALYVVVGMVVGVVITALVVAGGSKGPPDVVAAFAAIGVLGFALMLVPLVLLFAYAHPAIQLEYLRTGSVFSGLHFGALWSLMARRPGEYLTLFLYLFAVRFVATLVGELLCLIGLLATIPWNLATAGYLLGNYWARLEALDARDGPAA